MINASAYKKQAAALLSQMGGQMEVVKTEWKAEMERGIHCGNKGCTHIWRLPENDNDQKNWVAAAQKR